MQFLIRHKNWFLLGLLLVSAFLIWNMQYMRVDFSFEKFHPKGEKEYLLYERYKEIFPHYDNAVQVAVRGPQGDIWQAGFLKEVDSIFRDFRKLPHVDTVLSPTDLKVYRRSGLGVSERPLIAYDDAEAVAASRARLDKDSVLYFNFFSENREYIGGLVMLNPAIIDSAHRDSVNYALEARLKATGYEYVLSGEPFVRTQYVDTIRDELLIFIGMSIILTMIVMLVLYGTWWGMMLPQVGVLLAMAWTMGFMGWVGKTMDMVAELLPPIMFVVGIADIVHLFTRYQQDLHRGLDRHEAMKTTMNEIGAAIFLTSVTTAIGFISLIVSPLPPVKEFGVIAAIGVMFAYVIAIIVIPNALLRINPEKIKRRRGIANMAFWEPFLEKIYQSVRKGPVKVVIGAVAIITLAVIGMSQISFNTYLLDDLGEDDPARKGMRFFESNFYGARPFEMAIIPKNGHTVTDYAVLTEVEKIQDYIHSQVRISPFLSIVNYLKGANRLYRGGRDKFMRLPKTEDKIEELIGFGYSSGGAEYLDLVMNKDRSLGRVSGRMGDIGTEKFGQLRDGLADFVRQECNTDVFAYHLTGTAVITDRNVQFLREGLFAGLGLAFLLIALLMGALFRSWRMLFIGVIPNIIPLLITAGAMGFLGISLRSSTSIVFLVAFGIAVDDTIHFLSRLRLELKEGKDVEASLRAATVGTGKALIITSIILMAGFVLLLTSDFGGTYIVGLFTALTLVVALLSDLLLVPVLIRWSGIGKKRPQQKPAEIVDGSEEEAFEGLSEQA